MKFNPKDKLEQLKRSLEEDIVDSSTYEPIATVNVDTLSADAKKELDELGWKAISRGECACVILSGGQGTRLGFNAPKGMYNIGLPSKKCIFQIHIEKILKIKNLCKGK